MNVNIRDELHSRIIMLLMPWRKKTEMNVCKSRCIAHLLFGTMELTEEAGLLSGERMGRKTASRKKSS